MTQIVPGRRSYRVAAVVLGVLALLGVGLAAPASAAVSSPPLAAPVPGCARSGDGWTAQCPAGRKTLKFHNKGGFDMEICLKSGSTLFENSQGGDQRHCSGRKNTAQEWELTVPVQGDDDQILIDYEIFGKLGQSTWTDADQTGKDGPCTVTGVTEGFKIDCGKSNKEIRISKPTLTAYQPAMGSSEDPLKYLLNILAWAVTAASVAGLIITGINMALQLRRGEPGEFSEHWRGLVYVGSACMLGLTAGPLVQFLEIWEFLGN
ncbi:hypothetical protein [Jidongwangia harbinensis]|uniref:hypothetical protein n=1 Tax=Jidongwangia harbinensis TaxID=2878561 RepID=UPI001CDA32E7|nr:hypothetical protein [Jidongwangia harbinensis]MCA2211836.1 hypothetical protein [Jidongwangia harbinensis]